MRKQSRSIIYPKNKSVQLYLDKLLYPSLQKAMDELLGELENKFSEDLQIEFNKNFFENKAQIIKKQRDLLYLEKDSDFSDSEYDHYVKVQMELLTDNEVNTENEDFENSAVLEKAGEELNKEEEDMKHKFDPLEFLSSKLKQINFNKHHCQESDKIYFD